MPAAGIDIGSLTAKAALMEDGRLVGGHMVSTGADSSKAGRMVMDELLELNGLRLGDLDYVVATGYGRLNVPFAHKQVTEITCHARGAHWFFPDVRTLLDVGGQDCKAIHFDGQGRVMDFVLNDKCAAGTGRFLERMARLIGLDLEEIGPRSLEPVEGPLPIDSACAVFAENDVLEQLRAGRAVNDILAGIVDALAVRLESLIKRIGFVPEFSISGGVAKNAGIVKRLNDRLNTSARLAPDTQLVGAVGAALLAGDLAARNSAKLGFNHGGRQHV